MPVLEDHLRRSVRIPDNPERIISFSPAVTETLFELGLEDRIVGVSAFCARPGATKSKRKVGSYGSARIEVIREMSPDLILAVSGFQREFAENLGKEFPVFVFELPSSVGGIIDLVSKVGIVTGRSEKARHLEFELAKYLGSMRRHPSLRGYLEIDLGGPVTFGALSYITDALGFLGVVTPYSNETREWVQPDFSLIRNFDPQIIFYEPKMYSTFDQEKLYPLMAERGWNETEAFTRNRVFRTPGKLDFFAHHGPSFIREVMPWAMEKIESVF